MWVLWPQLHFDVPSFSHRMEWKYFGSPDPKLKWLMFSGFLSITRCLENIVNHCDVTVFRGLKWMEIDGNSKLLFWSWYPVFFVGVCNPRYLTQSNAIYAGIEAEVSGRKGMELWPGLLAGLPACRCFFQFKNGGSVVWVWGIPSKDALSWCEQRNYGSFDHFDQRCPDQTMQKLPLNRADCLGRSCNDPCVLQYLIWVAFKRRANVS